MCLTASESVFFHGVRWPLTYLFSDLQRPLAQGLCFLVLPPLPIQDSQVIKCGSDLTGTQTLFIICCFSILVLIIIPHVQPRDSATAAEGHWSGERVINKEEEDVRKQEVIMVGCNLIQIRCMTNFKQSARGRLQRCREDTSDLWFRRALGAMWAEWEEGRGEGGGGRWSLLRSEVVIDGKESNKTSSVKE